MTAASQLKVGDIDWDDLFGRQGVRWFHTGGIYAALSESTAEVTAEAVQSAQKYGTVVSYDLNYRPSLWKSIGGIEKAQEVNRAIARNVDVMIGNEEDFTACLGFEVEGVDEAISSIEVDSFKKMITQVLMNFPILRPPPPHYERLRLRPSMTGVPSAGRMGNFMRLSIVPILRLWTGWVEETVLHPA